ncbi:MAG: sigma-70 family RNA polymerase sigma factor [Planctomycetota bacterium]
MSSKGLKTTQYLEQWYGGDPQGLDALLECHLPWIRNRVHKRLGPLLRRRGETEDFVQEAVVQFLRYGPKIQIEDGRRFRALLARIVENSLRDQHDHFTAHRRNIAKEHPLSADTRLSLDPTQESVKTPSEIYWVNEQEAWIRLGMELVESEDRLMLIYRQWNKMSFKEIAEQLGITEKTAWMRHNRAVVKLSKIVMDLRQGKEIEALEEE